MHLDNWLFIVFVAVAMLFRWLASAASKANKNPDETERRSTSTPPPTLRPTRGDSQEEQIRKFLEALGRAPGAGPPPVVRPRTDIPPRPIAPVHPPREMVASAPRRREAPPPPKIQLPREVTIVREERTVVPPPPPSPPSVPTAAYDIVTQPEVVRRDKIDIGNLLRSPSGLRHAVVLREIFGPPRSMQDVDVIGPSRSGG